MGVKKRKSEVKAFCLLLSVGSPAGLQCFMVLQPVWAMSFTGKKEKLSWPCLWTVTYSRVPSLQPCWGSTLAAILYPKASFLGCSDISEVVASLESEACC